ncbi:MAG TPA: hypothetical protein VEI03_17055 [Stellaceae bacterium]|nr:hypothetical protein [Stellaceae bacterium]
MAGFDDSFEKVDEFLVAQHHRHLEDVLCDGCLIGRLSPQLGERARLMARLIRSVREEDGGLANAYEGILVLDGIWYRFACQVFIDQGGQRFLSDVSQFEAVEWRAQGKVPA